MFEQLVTFPNPSVRFWALTELGGLLPTAPEVCAVREQIPRMPAVRAILDAQYPQGYWMHPGLGIAPHYRATAWQVLFLAQFGVMRLDPVDRALDVLLAEHHNKRGARLAREGFRTRRDAEPSLALTGALLWALGRMGYTEDARLASVWDWAMETCKRQRCALKLDAATWMLRAAVVWQESGERRFEGSEIMTWCADVLGTSMVSAGAPYLYFPVADCFGRLMIFEALVEAGRGECVPPQYVEWLALKRRADGFWPLERVPGRLWWDPGRKGSPDPWITIRALKVLRGIREGQPHPPSPSPHL
jgi:hypothetical protein